MGILSSVLGFGSSIVGGLFNKSEADANRKAQKNFISDRVADAKRAGIHPLAALGSSASYTPINSGFGDAVAAGGAHLAEGARRAEEKATKGVDPVSQSTIKVNEAQAALLDAQRLSIANTQRQKAVGAVGGQNPEPALTFEGDAVPGTPETSSADALSKEHGEVGEWLAGLALANKVYERYGGPRNVVRNTYKKVYRGTAKLTRNEAEKLRLPNKPKHGMVKVRNGRKFVYHSSLGWRYRP